MFGWNANQYQKFEAQRTLPAMDLARAILSGRWLWNWKQYRCVAAAISGSTDSRRG